HFRADSIVADAELIRAALGSGPWSIYGQSYGGFCALTYLSFAPDGLKEALITGGLAPLAGHADDVYRATFARVAARNTEYFSWYPEDRR
ncbi:alpha/beta fold hydrolase, partial [Arthrobacter sp. AL08]